MMCREHTAFICIDDKHQSEGVTERGRRVMVRLNETFEVGDHDFTKFSMIPSVTLSVNIPEDVTQP